MKQYYCQSCLFDKHEIMGCAAQQPRWALEDLCMNMPFADKIFGLTENSLCEHFEQVDLGEE